LQSGRFETDGGLAIACAGGVPGPAVISVRPERLVLGSSAGRLDNRLSGTVEFVSYLGANVDVHVRVSPLDRVVVTQPNRADIPLPEVGEGIEVGWPAEAGIVFAEEATRMGNS
jgi:putative spermidine/putrescine transport system ATP-binding protein